MHWKTEYKETINAIKLIHFNSQGPNSSSVCVCVCVCVRECERERQAKRSFCADSEQHAGKKLQMVW